MFDLWGQTVTTPLPALELKAAEVNPREKLQWEKELLGVALSRKFIEAKKESGMIWPSEIDAEMDGQSVLVVGEISQVTQLFTRDHKAFIKAAIEDISGSIETMVWPRIYDADRELWQEGNTVVVEGKVRLRDDNLQLNCDRAYRYEPALEQEKPMTVESPIKEDLVTAMEAVPAQQTISNSHIIQPAASNNAISGKHRIFISLGQTEDKDGDISRLHQIVDVLREFAGEDEVSLCLNSNGSVTYAKLTNLTTGYCSLLKQRLEALVGEGGMKVEEVR